MRMLPVRLIRDSHCHFRHGFGRGGFFVS